MKNTPLKICNVTIQPGETANLALPLPDYNSCTSFFMPIKVTHGKNEGPCILIFSGLIADEMNGIEIINRLIKDDSIKLINGTVITIPIINVPSLVNPTFHPFEKNFEDCFPGKADGSYGERIAEIFTKELLSKVNYLIELKTGRVNDDILPQIYADLSTFELKKLAKDFGAPVINHTKINTSLHDTAYSMGIPFLIYKAGEACRFDEKAIEVGKYGIINLLNSLDMIKGTNEEFVKVEPIFSVEQEWVRAHYSGILINDLKLGHHVSKKDILGHIQDPFNAELSEVVSAPKDGIIVGINRNPLIFEGQNIYKIATFMDNIRAELFLEEWSAQGNEHEQ
ncbi:succinylglutamate desuccinylase/aspartoacylase family protein [Legionella saoudiensis]|uniref:succinylglutamate desuccinylase/aspartoacylase family protein n=1 Tax=Legionella saoudiensis TaxID=1750561 RepID=UPI00072FB0D5|nr:succinylglutamate desuccinylase/aspartoacylase family protein [Legionella saoudiensis]